jgi:hypothetical protein
MGGVDLEMQHSPPLFPTVGEIMMGPPANPVASAAGAKPIRMASPAKIPQAK